MRTLKSTFGIGFVLLLVCLAPATAAAGQSQQATAVATTTQQAAYSVSVSVPGDVTTGQQEVAVTVTNNGNADLLNPVVEVPLSGAIDATPAYANNATAVVDGTNEQRDAEINTSTMVGGDAMFVFGREVPAGEQRTYYFTVDMVEAGSVAIDAEVRPLYNDDRTASASTTVQAKGYGNFTVEVRDANGSPVSGATVSVGTETATTDGQGQTPRLTKLEGNYTVTASGVPGVTSAFRNISLGVQEDRTLTFTAQSSVAALSDPAVTATTAGATVIPPSVGSTDDSATATRNGANQSQYTVSTGSGETVVSERVPTDLRPLQSVQVGTSNNGAVVSTERANGILNYTLDATDDTDVTVTFTGYKLGDAGTDGTVDDNDAHAVASRLADRNASGVTQYGDVNEDGNVTVVDAMYIAQYDNGVRDEQYQTGGGT